MPDLLAYCLIAIVIDNKMKPAGNFIIQRSQLMLESKKHAVFYAAILSVLPFASWLSVALMALVTLRKGGKAGFEVMLPAMIVHSVPLMTLLPLTSALVNTLVAYLPCYLAAICLRKTVSWQGVFGVFLVQALIGFLSIQVLAPDFVLGQFNQIKSMISQYQEYQSLIEAGIGGISNFDLAQLFFGIQILSVIFSAMISLLFARSVQSTLFNPGAFKEEVLKFRGGKLSFLVLISVCIAAYYEIPIALNILPLVLCYLLISGFSLAYFIFSGKKQVRLFVLLFLLLLFKPFFVILACIVFGSLDSVFNFRLYLPKEVRKST